MFSNLQSIAGCSVLTFFGIAGWQISDRLTPQHITMLIVVVGALAFAVVGGMALGIGLSLAGGRTRARSEARPTGHAPYGTPIMMSQVPSAQPTGSFTPKSTSGWL